jgi:uncharacterized protein with HEPN domain
MPRHDPQVRLQHMLEYDIIWSTVTEDLPPLIAELEKIL